MSSSIKSSGFTQLLTPPMVRKNEQPDVNEISKKEYEKLFENCETLEENKSIVSKNKPISSLSIQDGIVILSVSFEKEASKEKKSSILEIGGLHCNTTTTQQDILEFLELLNKEDDICIYLVGAKTDSNLEETQRAIYSSIEKYFSYKQGIKYEKIFELNKGSPYRSVKIGINEKGNIYSTHEK